MNNNRRTVAIYGSASITPDSADWQLAHAVGQQLAEAGYPLLTGGYGGAMEAASQGAADAGGHVIGVGVGLFERRGLRLNRWVKEAVSLDTLRDRLFYVVQQPDAYVALRGGVGTLSEIALAWSLMQVGELPPRPFVLFGPMWRRFVAAFAEEAVMDARELKRLTLVDDVDAIVPALDAWWASPPDLPLRLGDDSSAGPGG
jgi:uncharacterized protein (TIGR00730 family)